MKLTRIGSAAAVVLVALAPRAHACTASQDRVKTIGNSTAGAEYRARTFASGTRAGGSFTETDTAVVTVLGKRFTVLTLRTGAHSTQSGSRLGAPKGAISFGVGNVDTNIDFDARTFTRTRAVFTAPSQISIGPIPVYLELQGTLSITIPTGGTSESSTNRIRATWGPTVGVGVTAKAAVGVSFAHVGVQGDLKPLTGTLGGFMEMTPGNLRVGVSATLGWSASLALVAKAGVGWFSASYTWTPPGLSASGTYARTDLASLSLVRN